MDRMNREWPQLVPVWAELRDRAFSDTACALVAEIQGMQVPDNAMIPRARWETLRAAELLGGVDHLTAAAHESAKLREPSDWVL